PHTHQTTTRTAEFTVKAPQATKTAANATPGTQSKLKPERLRTPGALVLTPMVSSFAAIPAAAQAKPVPRKLAGVVRDAAGTPQMGASVELVSEAVGVAATRGL